MKAMHQTLLKFKSLPDFQMQIFKKTEDKLSVLLRMPRDKAVASSNLMSSLTQRIVCNRNINSLPRT